MYEQYRDKKAPATCCSDYWKFKDVPKTEFNVYTSYCSIYLIDGDTSGNPLLDRLNHKLFKRVNYDLLLLHSGKNNKCLVSRTVSIL